MNKLIALVVASTFALGAASSFAASTVTTEQVRTHHNVVKTVPNLKQPKFHQAKHSKPVHRHHHKRHHRHHV